MLVDVGYGLLGAFMIIFAALVARRVGLPAPVLLVAASILYALLPGPNIALDSEVVLVLVLPPLLYSAALNSSLTGIRANLRTVISLSVLLIVATDLLTGYLLVVVVPGLPFAAACALGAALAPTDPVSALSIGRRVSLPERLRTVIEGESLLTEVLVLTGNVVDELGEGCPAEVPPKGGLVGDDSSSLSRGHPGTRGDS